jgi:hypothetical protein
MQTSHVVEMLNELYELYELFQVIVPLATYCL